jgi:outer membrane protein OmpA-like peptidoglycan-associated protein
MTLISLRRDSIHGRAVSGFGWVGVLLLAGCTSIQEPTVAFAAAERAIASADRARVAEAAAPELEEAREKLVAARVAAAERRMVEAERLALEARIDADLATARSEAAKAQAVNDERRRSTDTLQAQARKADAAVHRAVAVAQDAGGQREQAKAARSQSVDAGRNSRELQKQIEELQAKVTDRGLVLTLNDVLFTPGTAQLHVAESANLGKLAEFLNRCTECRAVIEGHTDNTGDEDSNIVLSQRRADAVMSYLVMREGIDSRRLTAYGRGEGSPVRQNDSALGRQQNRRVEVIIEDSPLSRGSSRRMHRIPVLKQPAEELPSR